MSFADKSLVFGGASPGTPWGTLGAVTARALEPHGYKVRVEPGAWGGRCPRMVHAGELEFGATQEMATRWSYQGLHQFAAQGPLPRLRVIATIMMPVWFGIAVRWETGITNLHQIKEKRLPIRIYAGHGGPVAQKVLDYYGIGREALESWGGRMLPPSQPAPGHPGMPAPWVRTGEVDVIMENIYPSYTLEANYWWDASVLMNLRYLPMPDDLIQAICRDLGGEPGFIPYRLLRGVIEPTASFSRPRQLIFARDDMPEEFAYLLAKALDDGRHLFRETLIHYSYDSKTVARDNGIPLHSGAAHYYREKKYLA